MCNEREATDDSPLTRPTTDRDVMNAIVVGCNQGHAPSIDSARRILTNIAQGPPETLAEVFEALLDGGVFTDEEIESETSVQTSASASG